MKIVKEVLGSRNAKMITKCTIAYFLGSLATYDISPEGRVVA